MRLKKSVRAAIAALGIAVLLPGCGKSPAEQGPDTTHASAASGHTHDGWWCDEHGVPEEICALCNPKVATELKTKGDWCAQHDCPDSQCFTCHPELEAKFAAQYEAKFNKQPPKRSM
ncbi:MAG: RND transporter [Pirellulales bacterium]|nr:RND transporter [Pirellulales bacterium]